MPQENGQTVAVPERAMSTSSRASGGQVRAVAAFTTTGSTTRRRDSDTIYNVADRR